MKRSSPGYALRHDCPGEIKTAGVPSSGYAGLVLCAAKRSDTTASARNTLLKPLYFT